MARVATPGHLDLLAFRAYLPAMAIRRFLTIDNPADLAVLKQISTPVEGVDDGLRALMDDMLETMYAAPGIGLAAVQVGDTRRVIVMDLGDKPGFEAVEGEGDVRMDEEESEAAELARRNPRYLVNPEITWASDETFTYEEGCLSVPEYFDAVDRPARVRLTYLNYAGERVEEEADGMYAVCIQHEMDHLMGRVFVEYLSPLKRNRIKTKMLKAQREGER